MSMNVNNNGTYGVNVPLTGTAYANVQKADELVKANSEAAGVMIPEITKYMPGMVKAQKPMIPR